MRQWRWTRNFFSLLGETASNFILSRTHDIPRTGDSIPSQTLTTSVALVTRAILLEALEFPGGLATTAKAAISNVLLLALLFALVISTSKESS